MQLNTSRPLKHTLAALTAAVLGTGIARAAEPISLESSLLIYSEKNRVTAAEGIVGLSHMLKGDYLLSMRLTYDGLTGSSPNGATPSSRIQTFTRPSGQGAYTIQPGKTALDDTFKDTRFGFDGSVAKPLGRLTNLSVGAHLSSEHDYSSVGINAGLTQDFFRKNTTIGISGAYARDNVKAQGGAPIPFSAMQPPTGGGGEHEDDEGEGSTGPGKPKDVVDAIVSLSQILDRKMILRLNYSYNRSSGYLTDPYKLLSVVQNSESTSPGEPESYLYEKRPDTRSKQAVYAELRRYLGGHTVDLSYRYFWDDWGMTSHTADFFFTWQFKNNHSLQPHVRWYTQTAADFHRYFLVSGQPLPEFASADSRLAKFDALTVGLQYSLPVDDVSRFNVTAEYYTQMGDKSPPEAFGDMRQYDLFPKLNALMLRVGYTRGF